jgi:hypothetical protein
LVAHQAIAHGLLLVGVRLDLAGHGPQGSKPPSALTTNR